MTALEIPHDFTRVLDEVTVAAYALDRDGRFVWQNRRSIAVFGFLVGTRFTHVVVRDDVARVRAELEQQFRGEVSATELTVTVTCVDGHPVAVRAHSVPIWKNGGVVGVFGLAYPSGPAGAGSRSP